MKKTLLPVVLFSLVLPYTSFAQEYSYTHYGIAEGLAGSTVYCITQDKDGFIWTGTETGVSRFDGTRFKNFTTKDGLPDLEVLQMFGDSKGRVWMAPLRKSICFYYQGKIHNEQNDSLLSAIHLRGNIEGFAEDAGGNVLLQERTALHVVNRDGVLAQYDSLDHTPIRKCLAVSRSSSGHFLARVGQSVIEFSDGKCLHSESIPFPAFTNPNYIAMSHNGIVWRDSLGAYKIRLFLNKEAVPLPLGEQRFTHISFTFLDDSLVYSNGSSGSIEYNIHTGQTKTYLQGIPVSRIFRDVSGNVWFTTMGDGLFRLNSTEMKIIRLTVRHAEKSTVTTITRVGHELWVGDNHSYIFRYSLPDLRLRDRKPCFYYMASRILFIDTLQQDKILTGGDYGLSEGTRSFHFVREIPGSVKSAIRINDRKLLLAGAWGAGIFDLQDFHYRDILWHERATVVFYKEDTIYVGTLNGLYRSVKSQPLVFLGAGTPFLRKRIASIAESADGTLWIASYDDAGIIGYKNNRQVAAITRQEGLTSDICRTLLVHHNILWVGTDKGLNRIELDKPGYHVSRYTSGDGLASDMINTLFADSSRVYVGTSAGLSFFDEKSLVNDEACRLYLLSLINSERERIADTGNLVIPYTNKRVRFEFAGISYRSAGDMVYRYRMLGLDTVWRETKEHFLEYPDLPSGNYEWQLVAINKSGHQSRILRLPITVTIQFWKKTWFALAAWLFLLLASWLLVSLRVRSIRRRQREKERLMQRMSELENIALMSQMNPHFIFNCLNSIQQFIFSGDIAGSNKYITGLARLIRITLNNSSRSFVCIGDEVDYLSSYLSLEKLRFRDKIDYELLVDPSIDQSAVLIPPMLIQPYVENSLQHGLQHKTGSKGFISIKMNKAGNMLLVTVEDNGIGRAATAAKKERLPAGHLSKGMSLTEDRIGIMNKLYEDTTSVAVTDLKDDTGSPAGTRIVIRLPLFQEQSLYY